MPETGELRLQLQRARASLLALDQVSETDRQIIADYLAAADTVAVPAGEGEAGDVDAKILADIVALAAARGKAAPPPQTPPPSTGLVLLDILQSPPFYFFFGCLLLVLAFVATQFNLNTSLTFLVAILGVAIVLYGTGSQAAGTFGDAPAAAQAMLAGKPKPGDGADDNDKDDAEDDKEAPRAPLFAGAAANVAIAGGAAVLAAFFGWGIIGQSDKIRQVLRDYDQYVQIRLEFCDMDAGECASAPNLKGADLIRASSLTPDVRNALLRTAYLETWQGERAYARETGNGLEFIVFRRDLGDSGMVHIVAQTMGPSGLVFDASDAFFSINAGGACTFQDAGPQTCGVETTTYSKDEERVPIVTLRAAITQRPVTTIPTNNGGTILVATPIEPS
ncbi:MAG: hypothetical protein KKF33_14880 [Alphaproteobacteria bacterium]|nr:hypothetical protein [Alphaproteobacteria bacterium]